MLEIKKIIKRFALFLIAVILFLTFFLPKVYVAPIIAYHSVSLKVAKGYRLSVSLNTFERQMRFLRLHHYNIVTLEKLARLVTEKKPIPYKTIALTFDDGYKDNYSYAFGILKKYNIPATIFVIINEVGRPDRLSWQDILTMQKSGLVNFGSHCLGPEPLINIKSEELLKKEIFDSKRILEEKLGKKVNILAYPGGFFNPRIKELVKEAGYEFALATNPGKKVSNNDPLALKRLRISENSRNLFVFYIESSGYYNFIREFRHKHK